MGRCKLKTVAAAIVTGSFLTAHPVVAEPNYLVEPDNRRIAKLLDDASGGDSSSEYMMNARREILRVNAYKLKSRRVSFAKDQFGNHRQWRRWKSRWAGYLWYCRKDVSPDEIKDKCHPTKDLKRAAKKDRLRKPRLRKRR